LNFRAVHFCMYNYWLPRQILVNTRTPLIDALGEMRVDNPLSVSLSTTPSLARLHVRAFSFSLIVVILISGFLSLCLSVTPSLCRSQTHSLAYTHSKTHTHATLPLSSWLSLACDFSFPLSLARGLSLPSLLFPLSLSVVTWTYTLKQVCCVLWSCRCLLSMSVYAVWVSGSCGSKSASQVHLNCRGIHFCIYNYWLSRQIYVLGLAQTCRIARSDLKCLDLAVWLVP